MGQRSRWGAPCRGPELLPSALTAAYNGGSRLQRPDAASELAPRGLCQGPLQPPHHLLGLRGTVQLPEATQVTCLSVPPQARLQHRDGDAEVQVRVGGPCVIVPGVAGHDAC